MVATAILSNLGKLPALAVFVVDIGNAVVAIVHLSQETSILQLPPDEQIVNVTLAEAQS